ncbi:hypothetical protein [Jiella sonneratiae]|uniref:Uncharacterized protein n=1 Tax=Jiella sonneratiae TaxID=2816856 RepID=A0ABS3J8H7_9HYPH|nr:hypothetical protein [Jiella sonneratiae]MBO0905972.1 hypothetical protein [Jiella sonneratiae]
MFDFRLFDAALLEEPGEPDLATEGDGSGGEDNDCLSAMMIIAYEVPLVLSLRIPLLVGETTMFSLSERRETRKAIVEKSGAFIEGVAAVQAATLAACLALQAESLSGRLLPWRMFGVVDGIVAAGLAPSVERLRANDDRLSTTA